MPPSLLYGVSIEQHKSKYKTLVVRKRDACGLSYCDDNGGREGSQISTWQVGQDIGLHLVDKARNFLITKMDGNEGKKEGTEEGRKARWMNSWMDDGWMKRRQFWGWAYPGAIDDATQ